MANDSPIQNEILRDFRFAWSAPGWMSYEDTETGTIDTDSEIGNPKVN